MDWRHHFWHQRFGRIIFFQYMDNFSKWYKSLGLFKYSTVLFWNMKIFLLKMKQNESEKIFHSWHLFSLRCHSVVIFMANVRLKSILWLQYFRSLHCENVTLLIWYQINLVFYITNVGKKFHWYSLFFQKIVTLCNNL